MNIRMAATKLRKNNQRRGLATVDLDKKDPLDLEPLNSEPKGNDKSKNNERLRERQEREKILQKNRLAQQENLKNRVKRNLSARRVPKADENSQLDENGDRNTGHHFVSPVQKSSGHNLETEQFLTSREHRKNDRSNDDALRGDWRSKSANHKAENTRCANCCGRPQHFPVENRTRCSFPLENYGNPPGISTGREANRCELELINAAPRTSGTSLIRAMEIGDSRLKGGRSAAEEKKCGIHGESSTANEERLATAGGSVVRSYDENESTERLRGGCGGCGAGRSCGSCPCGGCGGPACGSNAPGCSIRPAGCCGGNQPRGLPCRCRSCSDPCPPCGTCGGRNCGRWNSCAGSGGGKCCFPRNTRRRNGPDCCGGGSGGCGGCC
ncbi:uncharacterized protein LOC105689328 isoform X2 [Athalia rosae]|uniref:uncharacterized protein LOC105689328 isoform X2 n=1 Tax=Athalia rosae TaxID=37344 RepID=UPI002033D2DE|nr:uncharacterized protein LOC105689328 isoform X2 [Athalia rosae]